jgi:hypothetical protein
MPVMSVKEAYDTEWKARVRTRIRRSNEAWLDDQQQTELCRLLPFSPPQLTKVRTIGKASDGRFKDAEIRRILPSAISTLYELAILAPERFEAARKANLISHDMTREDVQRLKPPRPRAKQMGILIKTLWRDEAFSEGEQLEFDGRLRVLCQPLGIRILAPKRRPSPSGGHKQP